MRYRAYVKFPREHQRRQSESPRSRLRFSVSVFSSTRSKSARRISAKRWKIFTAFLISLLSFHCCSEQSEWRARFKRICNKRSARRRFCAAWVHPRARLFLFISYKRLRWVWLVPSRAPDLGLLIQASLPRVLAVVSTFSNSDDNFLATDFARNGELDSRSAFCLRCRRC